MRITASDLGADRGGERIFSDLSFSVSDGGCLLVTGPNGSGKSTLLRAIGGLLPLSEGAIALEPASETWPTVASACHYLGHHNGLKQALSVEENLRFWRDFSGEERESVEDALDQVGLYGLGHLPFGVLSTGQRRRVAIARLLVTWRPIWLLDEPTAGLDARSETRFAGLMEAHREAGGIIIAATHWPLGLADVQEFVMGEMPMDAVV
ncbi:heme ABC exporter ATP-binding protein CcmA [Tianweitania sp. BSSL-BM11]|uniref:Heme ABC exporter ATP-binding protein CcmA n=1 Tax=Tianweitania aestuarii TaxID=2814886 RepID=A0ABS5RZ45_9HYPH|nr:heme ABC exporter ATP-binding protein CcmA [Tianweitania aestuarii]MBS9722272.1 heme ABC exporter ATP-binding protein CcmA [Tianweitania aestuarii]